MLLSWYDWYLHQMKSFVTNPSIWTPTGWRISRSHRERLSPSKLGLASAGRRRTRLGGRKLSTLQCEPQPVNGLKKGVRCADLGLGSEAHAEIQLRVPSGYTG